MRDSAKYFFSAIMALSILCAFPVWTNASGNAVDYALCDARIVVYFEDMQAIDWPTLYYLNDYLGCRIDLIQCQTRAEYSRSDKSIPVKEFYLHTFGLPPDNISSIDSITTGVFESRPPDVVILFDISNQKFKEQLIGALENISNDSANVFGATSLFELVKPTANQPSQNLIIINSDEILKQNRDRMRDEIPRLFESFNIDTYSTERLVYFGRINSRENRAAKNSFLSEKSLLRLTELAQSRLTNSPSKSMFIDKAKRYTSSMNGAKNASGKQRTTMIIDAYRALLDLNEHPSFQELLEKTRGLKSYMNELFSKAERAALDAVGLTWNGQIIIRDTPQGPSVKYRASISVDGPTDVQLSRISFHPYWEKSADILDSTSRTIAPHQSFVREYLIDIDKKYLESNKPESLSFTADIAYSRIPLKLTDKLPLWESPDLTVSFVPNFYFLPPVARLDIDRVVESMSWKVAITKPYDFDGSVHLNLQTPKGMFAGAYKQEIQLESGVSRQIFRIPFTVSNLFELGIQQATVSLTSKDKVIASDTSRVRIAECHIADTIKIGFLPDTTGQLEDILSMTNAGYQPITDRTLAIGDLSAFDVLIIGSGAFKNLPSFRKVRDRFENYIRDGGSIVVLGQPNDWPLNSLPASISPTFELASNSEFTNRIPEARILSKPYKITEKNLLSSFYKPVEVASAIVTPAEQVYVTPSGSTVLSVSRLGSGQLIYCGLPVLQMISKLNIDAIHLFANILNY